jgi:RES domain
VELITYRFASWDTPLWVNPNRSPGRFNRAESAPTQYLCLHPLGPWAEYLRREGFTGIEELLELRGRVWVLRVNEAEIFDLNFGSAAQLDIAPQHLVGDEHGPCQELADRCRADPSLPKVLLVPSAALPGTRNLVIFGTRIMAPYLYEPIDLVDVPTSITAEDGRPLHSLIDLVRYQGQPHPELRAWEKREPFQFDEPLTSLLDPAG